MPLIKNRNPNIHIWKNRETPLELLGMLKNKAIHEEKVAHFKSDERIKQYLTNRLLIQTVIGDYTIKKGLNNKPYVVGLSLEVSFSHNKEFTILMTSNLACGIDVQAPTEKALRVKSKFINNNDFCFNSNDIQTLSKAWSCKEAAFKKFGNHEIFLKENITIAEEVLPNKYKVLVEFDHEKHEVVLQQESIENNYLFYTIN